MDRKKILILCGIFYPSQYPRAHRATELAIELARKGNEVVVYAVLGNYDYSKFELKYNLRIRNIENLKFLSWDSDGFKSKTLLKKILGRVFNRLLEFPDIELTFRIPKIFIKEKKIDLLISIARPFPIHWGCALSKSIFGQKFPKIWIADCGDPYMGNKVVKNKPIFYFKYVEKWFCNKTDYITVPIEGAKVGYYPEFHYKIKVIPQGFQFELTEQKMPNNIIPTFAYSGIFYKDFRDPRNFFEFLCEVDQPFKFIVYTADDSLIKQYKNRLKDKLEVNDYVPRQVLLTDLSQMDFLINFGNGTSVQSPSKLIDYSIVQRPILSIDSTNIYENIFFEFLNGNYSNQYKIDNINQYNIVNVANNFMELYQNKI